jgi:hypothetical protein
VTSRHLEREQNSENYQAVAMADCNQIATVGFTFAARRMPRCEGLSGASPRPCR